MCGMVLCCERVDGREDKARRTGKGNGRQQTNWEEGKISMYVVTPYFGLIVGWFLEICWFTPILWAARLGQLVTNLFCNEVNTHICMLANIHPWTLSLIFLSFRWFGSILSLWDRTESAPSGLRSYILLNRFKLCFRRYRRPRNFLKMEVETEL